MATRDDEQDVKGGPANHAAHSDLDAPTPPGGPQRQDRADADVHPTGAVDPGPDGPDPDLHPDPGSASPTRLSHGDRPDGAARHEETDPKADPEHPLQAENAETAMDQPSDGSGGE